MAATKAPKERAPNRHWPMAEKRRIVELTLRPGASLVAIAREHDVTPNNLYRWKRLYTGKLDAPVKPSARVAGPAASATFVPVSVVPEMRRPQPATRPDAVAGRSAILQLVLASGAQSWPPAQFRTHVAQALAGNRLYAYQKRMLGGTEVPLVDSSAENNKQYKKAQSSGFHRSSAIDIRPLSPRTPGG